VLKKETPQESEGLTPLIKLDESAKSQEELAVIDLHVTVRKFLEKYTLSVENLNSLS